MSWKQRVIAIARATIITAALLTIGASGMALALYEPPACQQFPKLPFNQATGGKNVGAK